jgi:hypothetical protein
MHHQGGCRLTWQPSSSSCLTAIQPACEPAVRCICKNRQRRRMRHKQAPHKQNVCSILHEAQRCHQHCSGCLYIYQQPPAPSPRQPSPHLLQVCGLSSHHRLLGCPPARSGAMATTIGNKLVYGSAAEGGCSSFLALSHQHRLSQGEGASQLLHPLLSAINALLYFSRRFCP